MHPNRSQNRILSIIAISTIAIGLLIGLLWATLTTWSPSLFADNGPQNVANVPITPPAHDNDGGVKQAAPVAQASDTPQPATTEAADHTADSATPAAGSDIFPSSGLSGNTGEATGDNGMSTTDKSANASTTPAANSPASTTRANRRTAAATPAAGKGKAKVQGKGAAALGDYIPVSGVVDHLANNALVIDSGLGPITATLAATGTLARLPLPGDDANAKVGPISLSDVQVGSYATLFLSRDQVQAQVKNAQAGKQPANPQATPQANPANTQQNVKNLIQRKFGLGAGFSATAARITIGPAPMSIADASAATARLVARGEPATLVSRNDDGSLTATITRYGNIKVVTGPATQYDRLGQPIKATDLKPGDDLLLYGANVYVGEQSGTGKGKGLKNGLPIEMHVASVHIVTTNEHVLQGRVSNIDSTGFQITTQDNETMTVTTDNSTLYQSLIPGQTLASLADLLPNTYATVYTLDDTDIDPQLYHAKAIYTLPALRAAIKKQ